MKIYMKFCSILIISIIILGACGDNEESSAEKEVSLIVSSGLSDQHVNYRGHFEPVINQVEDESDGRASFTIYTSGELVSLGDELHALEQGTIDVALTHMTPYDS